MKTQASRGAGQEAGGGKPTPMMAQYWRLKERCGDAILMFRLGDFYEMFFEDAERASKILDIALTSRNKNDPNPIPLCGVPFHSAKPYIAKLLEAGLKVAICEQMEDAAKAKGLVEREVVRVITPGTVLDEETLDPTVPNRLVALFPAADETAGPWGMAAVDFSTGGVSVATIGAQATEAGWGRLEALAQELGRLDAREVLVADGANELAAAIERMGIVACVSRAPGAWFSPVEARRWMGRWGEAVVELEEAQACALSGLLGYLRQTLRAEIEHLGIPTIHDPATRLMVDEVSRAHLALLPGAGVPKSHSLLGVLDRTATPMGARTLREWMLYPLADPELIAARLDAVEALIQQVRAREAVASELRAVGDLERLGARLGAGGCGPRELIRLARALERLEPIKRELEKISGGATAGLAQEVSRRGGRRPLLCELAEGIVSLPEVVAKIDAALQESAGTVIPGVIRAGYHEEVDQLRRIASDSKQVIAELEARERRRTGIASLKIRYNKVFGYYVEVSKANLSLVPEDYVRRQTLVGAERFITAELKECENRILGAEQRLRELEGELLAGLVAEVARHRDCILASACALARLDALLSLAAVAHERGYTRPFVDNGGRIEIREGRHPIVEVACRARRFVPNDCELDPETRQIILLTGPNMAGKSTYLRQVALIAIMAQMGSFVPAAQARVGVVDRIFTRVGASDNIAAGDSTFMVEMRETARILAGMTPRSLLILDEIGRGTSTFDGIAIAWSVLEYLHDNASCHPKTLFATHFYELTDLARSLGRLKNHSIAVREYKGDIVFLRQVVSGPASRSYGIEVARLAGLPAEVVARARAVLADLEQGQSDVGLGRREGKGGKAAGAQAQLELFGKAASQLKARLAAIDVCAITPLEAMLELAELVEEAKRG